MAGLVGYAQMGTLTIAGFSMNRPAWAVVQDEDGSGGLEDLIDGGDRRGEDRLIPSGIGVIPYPRRLTGTIYDLRLVITGEVNSAGTPVTDAKAQLNANRALIRYTLFEGATTASDGTVSATVIVDGWGSKTASIHMLAMLRNSSAYNPNDNQSIWDGTLRISVPAGRFT